MGAIEIANSAPAIDRNPVRRIVRHFSERARARRAEIFRQTFTIDQNTRILDLGYGGQANIKTVLEGTAAKPSNVYIADIEEAEVSRGSRKFGFVPVVIEETGPLPFPDQFFDIVYCSSVIEHVTLPKSEVWTTWSGRDFSRISLARQREFAREIMRVGKQYFVQCPYKHFPLESHSLMPLFGWLPRWMLIPALRVTNAVWIKSTSPDWHLLNKRQMMQLFDGAKLVEEKVLGMTKSIMAVKDA
jgi:hypothetical protein